MRCVEVSPKVIGIARHRLQTDGQGVSTLVAFHGCPLHCRYCLNPQSLNNGRYWKRYDCRTLYEEVKVDELYFLATGGGVTFGGGEPCLQSEFIGKFRELCGKEWLLTVETSLNVGQEYVERLLPVVDRFIIDIKDMNPDIISNIRVEITRPLFAIFVCWWNEAEGRICLCVYLLFPVIIPIKTGGKVAGNWR